MGRVSIFRQLLWARAKRLWSPLTSIVNAPNFGIIGEGYPEEHYPDEPALGMPPNLGHDTDSYSADYADIVDKNTRALAVSLGGSLMRDDIEVEGGHAHADYKTELDWQNFGAWRPLGDNQGSGGPDESKHLLYVTTTAPVDGIVMTAHIPEHIRDVEIWVRVAQPAPGATGTPDGWLRIGVETFDLHNDLFGTVMSSNAFALLSIAAGMQHPDKWLGPMTIDLVKLDFQIIRGQRWIAVKLSPYVSAGGTIGGLWEAALRRRSRGR